MQITVLNEALEPVAEGIRWLEVNLPPGLYEARFEAGSSVREQLISLTAGNETVEVHQGRIAFASAAPLPNTQSEVAEQSVAAAKASEHVFKSIGKGGQLLVFVRDHDLRARSNPAKGLTLHDPLGEMVGEIEVDGESGGGSDHKHPPWSACTYELPPGPWRLRCPAPDVGIVEQNVVVSSGWQTQVFLQRRPSRSGGPRRPDFADASVLMAGVRVGFKPELAELRATELARQGLRDRRFVVEAGDLLAMLHKKKENPMLGIYGAHLMIQEPDPDREFVKEVTGNLRQLVGEHPDVMALELWLDPQADVGDFSQPPMLQSSWSIIVAATADRPELVPRDSPAASISQQVFAAGPWLRWRTTPTHRSQVPSMPTAGSVSLRDALAWIAEALPEDSATVARQASEASMAESGVISFARRAGGKGASAESDADILEQLGVPRAVAEDALHSVLEQLDG